MKKLLIPSIIALLLLAVGFAYFYFFFHGPGATLTAPTASSQPGFTPFGRPPLAASTSQSELHSYSSATSTTFGTSATGGTIPALRLLSSTPVGGYGASTTASTTVVRWIDRGRGNIIEAREDDLGLTTISNTVLPRIYESAWNKNLTSFVGGMLETDTGIPTFVYANIVKRPGGSSAASSTSTGVESTPFELKGGSLPADVIAFAPSPDGSKIFFMTKESGYGVGYIANYDGSGMKRIFSTPLTQVNVEWPVADTLAIATKGSATEAGFLYFFDIKTGAWKKIAGPLLGLSARVSHDGKYVLLSSTGTAKDVLTAIYNVSKGTYTDAVIRTLADKCAWGNFYQDIVYCAVPSQPVPGTYPDDWYTGTLSTVDKIWQENAQTGEIHLISSIVDQSDRVIDAFNLGLDRKDQYLFFMNKNDLTLWSLDLVASQ